MPGLITYLFAGTFLTYSFCFLFTMLRPTYYLTGDQAYYLVMAASLWEDGDLKLTGEYADEACRTFCPQTLSEQDILGHNLIGRDGELYSRHSAGLPFLILPGWGLGRQVGVSLWLIVLAALLLTHPLFQHNREIGQSSLFELLHATTGFNLNELWPSLIYPSPLSYWQATLITIDIAAGYGLIFGNRTRRARECHELG